MKEKANGLVDRKLVMINVAIVSIFSCSFDKSRKWEIKIKALNNCGYCDQKEQLSMSFEIQEFPITSSTLTTKVGSLTSFSSEDIIFN